MKSNLIVILLLFIFSHVSYSQTTIDKTSIKKQLEQIFYRDQKPRTGGDSTEFMQYIDSTNLVIVETIISQYGWLGISEVGKRANLTIWLVIQHADMETQEKYLPLLQKSVEEGESQAMHLAYLQDRILMHQGKKQIYGSQVRMNNTGGMEFYPIEDEMNVNERRKQVGLQPLEKYAKEFGIEYKLPKKEE